MGVTAGLVRDAVAQGDLVLPEGQTAESVVFGLWTMTYGGLSVTFGKPELSHVLQGDPFEALRHNQHVLMDGYGWQPLSTEWDYGATRERVLAEIFPDEARQTDLS